MGFYQQDELSLLGFKQFGQNVKISRGAIFYGAENIEIGDNVRIDDACIFLCKTGSLKIGSFIHIAARSTFSCLGGIEILDFAQIAAHCLLLSASDDFSGDYLIGPCVPEPVRNVFKAKIVIGKYSVIGAGCVISPGTIMRTGAALGAMSLTKTGQKLQEDMIYIGQTAKPLKRRGILQYELARLCLNQDLPKDNHKPVDHLGT